MKKELFNYLLETAKPYYVNEKRFYHNYDHIIEMLNFDSNIILNDSQILAIICHDIVYDTNRKDNEEQSVILMKKLFSHLFENEIIEKSSVIIRDTINHNPTIEDSKIVLDLDMMRLAFDYDVFIKHNDNVRKEYSQYNDEQWDFGRKQFLNTLLNKKIFHSEYFINKDYNNKLQKNIKKFLSIENKVKNKM